VTSPGVGKTYAMLGGSIGLSRTPPGYRRRPPRLGEHTGDLS
jgi:crotonobetainyl-CoA:carnitine CoA-transferase CaiB-like acyl-CoA transferase